MRIISEIRDYYDGVMQYGQDTSRCYIRKASEIGVPDELKVIMRELPSTVYWDREDWVAFFVVVVDHIYIGYNFGGKICYSPEEIGEFFEGDEGYYRKCIISSHSFCERSIKEAYEKYQGKRVEVCIGVGSPVIYVERRRREYKCVKDVILRELEFYRVMDAYTIFQEISMFNDGVMVESGEVGEVSDKVKMKKRGYDKWSFRKQRD